MKHVKRIGLAALALAAWVLCQSVVFPPGLLPPGPGRDLVATKCATCHNLNRVVSRHDTLSGWQDIANSMVTDNDADISDKDLATIAAYLTANYGPDSGGNWSAPKDAELLTADRGAIDALLQAAKLPLSSDAGWKWAEYATPLLHGVVVFALNAPAANAVLLLPQSAGAAAPRLVTSAASAVDAFNQLVAGHPPLPSSDAEWLEWARLYRAVAGAAPCPAAATVTHAADGSIAVPCDDVTLKFGPDGKAG